MAFFSIFKYILYITPVIIAALLGYYHKREDQLLKISTEINNSTKEKVCDLFKNIEFLRFHPCVKEIKFLEKTKIDKTTYDVYEIREEAEILMGLYKFQIKNKLYVEMIDECKIRAQIRLPLLKFFEAQFTSLFYVEQLKKDSFLFVEETKIWGIYYVIAAVKEYTKFFHEILFEKIKIFLESQV